MSSIVQRLNDIIRPVVEGLGYELWSIELSSGNYRSILRIAVESPGGVNLDECARISRQIAAVLDVADPLQARYSLEVSSPGVERCLITESHFARFIGQTVRVKLRVMREGQRQFKGVITAVEGDRVSLQLENELTLTVTCRDIEKAQVVPNFSDLMKRQKQ